MLSELHLFVSEALVAGRDVEAGRYQSEVAEGVHDGPAGDSVGRVAAAIRVLDVGEGPFLGPALRQYVGQE